MSNVERFPKSIDDESGDELWIALSEIVETPRLAIDFAHNILGAASNTPGSEAQKEYLRWIVEDIWEAFEARHSRLHPEMWKGDQ